MASNKSENELSTGFSQFGLNLHSECAQSSNQNVVISPLSVANVLTLLSQAAKGKTFDELRDALGLNADKATIAEQFFKFNEQIKKCIGTATLTMANQIYVRHGHKLNIDFRTIAVKKFGAGIDSIGFDNPRAAAQTINRFVNEKTMGKIPNAVTPDSFQPDTSVVLVNAISFKAKWNEQFESHRTRPGDFYINKTDCVQVEFMAQKSNFNYAVLDELNATALQMNYKNSDLSFVVILPNSRVGLYELESRLKNYDLSKVTNQMSNKLVALKLPRFKYEYEMKLDSVLQKMGMNEMFKQEDADLNGMLDLSTAGHPLFVSTVVHKAVIEVDEEGTEAAAFTHAQMVLCCAGADPPNLIRFNVDHPFFFFIGSSTSSMPLFCGSVYKPMASNEPKVDRRTHSDYQDRSYNGPCGRGRLLTILAQNRDYGAAK